MEKESNIPEQSTDAALELFRCVRHLVDTSVKNCLQSMPQQVMQMTGQLDKIQTAQQQSLFDLGSVLPGLLQQGLHLIDVTAKIL